MSESRTVDARKADVLASLEGQNDVWLATADSSGRSHLIAVSAWWDGTDLVMATVATSRIQAYRGYDELEVRDVMRNSRWLA